ncbi:MAG: hypothetical protein QXQ37_06620 [Nitrososphaerota archaeon]
MMGEKIGKKCGVSPTGAGEAVESLGRESGFFTHKDDLISDLGKLKKIYRYGLETWVEVYENGFVVYHIGNRKVYDKDRADEVFTTARILKQRERLLNKLFGE